MISDLKAYLFIMMIFVPGEMGLTALVLEFEYDLLNWFTWLCALGIWSTINFFVTAGFQGHVRERMEAEEQRRRIENG